MPPATRARIALLLEGHVQYSFMTIAEIERFYSRFYPRWRAIDASTGKLIGAIDIPREPSTARKVAKWISATKQLYTTE